MAFVPVHSVQCGPECHQTFQPFRQLHTFWFPDVISSMLTVSPHTAASCVANFSLTTVVLH